jgi:hypothetical protein
VDIYRTVKWVEDNSIHGGLTWVSRCPGHTHTNFPVATQTTRIKSLTK